MSIKPSVLKIEKGHVTLEKQCVYCWFRNLDSRTFYVGATWMHPVARVELHLHASDENARTVGVNLEKQGLSLNDPMRVLAFEVPDSLERKEAKTALISALARQLLLSDIYFGVAPDPSFSTSCSELKYWVNDVVQAIEALSTA